MLKEERWQKILNSVNSKGFVKNVDLASETKSTIQTIISDVNELDKRKLLIKVYGGAKSRSITFKTNEYYEEEKLHFNTKEKDMIAKYVADLVQDNDFIFIDTGTSTKHMIKYLLNKKIKIVTNGYSIARELIEQSLDVCLVGGELLATTHATVGGLALKFLDNFVFDKAFLGVNNVDESGIYTTNIHEALIKEKVLTNSKQTYFLCDSSKFGKNNRAKIDTNKDYYIVTDKKPLFNINNLLTILD